MKRVSVNGRQLDIHSSTIDYLSAIALAFPRSAGVLHTVTWKRPNGDAGSLVDGQSITVADGMIFNVMATNRA